jgi:broad specificity phosphatase PhoE
MPLIAMIIRHAEKPAGGGAPKGVSADGLPDPESLTPRGWQRAGALVGLFSPDPADQREPRLPTPTHLFASQVGPQSSSRRPLETLEPLSERLGLTIDARFLKEELGQLAQAVRGTDGVALISWEHHLIPSIANMLVGNTRTVPQIWPDDRFDVVWVIDLPALGKPAGFRQVPELLLSGDQAAPIA